MSAYSMRVLAKTQRTDLMVVSMVKQEHPLDRAKHMSLETAGKTLLFPNVAQAAGCRVSMLLRSCTATHSEQLRGCAENLLRGWFLNHTIHNNLSLCLGKVSGARSDTHTQDGLPETKRALELDSMLELQRKLAEAAKVAAAEWLLAALVPTNCERSDRRRCTSRIRMGKTDLHLPVIQLTSLRCRCLRIRRL